MPSSCQLQLLGWIGVWSGGGVLEAHADLAAHGEQSKRVVLPTGDLRPEKAAARRVLPQAGYLSLMNNSLEFLIP